MGRRKGGSRWRGERTSTRAEGGGRTDGHRDGRTEGCTHAQMDRHMDGRTPGRTDRQMDGWTDGRTDQDKRKHAPSTQSDTRTSRKPTPTHLPPHTHIRTRNRMHAHAERCTHGHRPAATHTRAHASAHGRTHVSAHARTHMSARRACARTHAGHSDLDEDGARADALEFDVMLA